MQSGIPDNSSGNSSSPKNEADEPVESESTPYMAPDGREHILEVGDEVDNTKLPQSE